MGKICWKEIINIVEGQTEVIRHYKVLRLNFILNIVYKLVDESKYEKLTHFFTIKANIIMYNTIYSNSKRKFSGFINRR